MGEPESKIKTRKETNIRILNREGKVVVDDTYVDGKLIKQGVK